MGSARAQIEQKVSELTPRTTLNKKVVHSLVEMFMTKCGEQGMDRNTFRDFIMCHFNILDDFILDRLFHTMDLKSNAKNLTVDDFVLGMGYFLTNSDEERMKFCFNVYDLTGEGYVTRDKMYPFLKSCIVTKSHDADQDDAEEGNRELMEFVLKMLDTDNDGRVSFEDYRSAVHKDRLQLELLGQCMPDEKHRCQCLKMLGDPDMNTQPMSISAVRQDKDRRSALNRRPSARGQKHSSQA